MQANTRRSKRIQTQQKAQGTSQSRSRKSLPVKETPSSSDGEHPKHKRARRGPPQKTILIPSGPPDPSRDPAPNETNPANIEQPIMELIHPALLNTWIINKSVNICFIFDTVSPARQFQRGVVYKEDADFPEYNDGALGDVTETDENPPLMPYQPRPYKWKYEFHCILHITKFMSWTMETEDLRVVEVKLTKRSRGKTRPKTVKKNYKLPPPYHRLVSQLVTEIDFAEGYNTHESHRRQVYAEEVLDEFGKELDGLKSTEDTAMVGFRSVVLTPILQRQLFGIHDAYTPYVHSIIMDNNPKLNIEAVTKFYLGEDPTDPAYIPTYRRNLLYLPEARWHLGLTMGVLGKLPEPKACGLYFDKIQNHHDMIIEALPGLEYDHDRFPLLTQAERSAIIEEGLELFFEEELARPESSKAATTSGTSPQPSPQPSESALTDPPQSERSESE